MKLFHVLLGGACLSTGSFASALPQNEPVARSPRPQRAEAVKEAFRHAWTGYYKYAFPNDELRPVTNGFSNTRNGWGASAVDALSTAIVMEEKKIVNQILDYIPTIDYSTSKNNAVVSLFETTIRYLGGMLSGYDFLTGPLSYLVADRNKDKVESLLTQSKRLADLLSFAFDTPTGIPYNNLYFLDNSTDGSETNGVATVGTLVLEWQRLSDLTGDPKYGRMARRAEKYLLMPRPLSQQPFPGLLGSELRISDGKFINDNGGWVGGVDSYYEYLIKMYVYEPSRYERYKNRWLKAVESSMLYLESSPSSRPDLLYLSEYDGRKQVNYSQHLACFDGGNFLLGGSVLKRPDIIQAGLLLVEGCYNTYKSTATGIGPEVFSWDTANLPADQADFYAQNGFWIVSSDYILRPEVIESYYYAYQLTGERKYQDWAWEAFKAINSTCRTKSGFSSIEDVNSSSVRRSNGMESFLFAETLKYSYLIQSEEKPWDFNAGGVNQWVYNTEAHPFLVKETPI